MATENKHFDVARPGSLAQPHTSRPIITNRDQLKRDPMVKPEESDVEEQAKPEKILTHEESAIKPPSQTANEDASKSQPDNETEEPKTEEPIDEPAGVRVKSAKNIAQNENDPVVDELIKSRKYELPIKHSSSSVLKYVWVFIVIIIAVLAGLFVLMRFTSVL